MAEPLGKREMIAWTIAGALAVIAGIGYSKRADSSTSVQPQLTVQSPLTTPVKFDSAPREKVVFVRGDTAVKFQDVKPPDTPRANVKIGPLPPPEMSTPLTKREPRASTGDTSWIRVGTRVYKTILYVNDQSYGEIYAVRVVPVPAGTIRISLRAPDCSPWDTTITIVGGDSATLGRRMPRC
jgi:hypothetical protein